MHLQLITPERVLFEGEAYMVTAPGVEGDFGVLDGHMPFISTLRPGVIIVDLADGQTHRFTVAGGVAEVVPDRVTILAEKAVDMADADAEGKARELTELAA